MKLLQKLIILMSVISFAGCGWFGGDKKEVEEVVKSDASAKSEGAAKTEDADKENKDETANASKKKKNEGKEKGFFASITSILPGSDEVQEVQKDEDSKLQVARLIARVEELTSHVIKMQSRLVVLEKSVHLGISPESMNSKIVVDGGNLSANSAPTQVSPSYTGNSGMHTNVVQEQNSVTQIPTQVKSSKFDDYQRDLNKAISLFKKGEYGSAYVSFNNIDATYTDNVKQGLPEYWIARSWYRLREFQSAKKYFQSFVRKYPTSIQAPMAKYYLAKIDVSMGMPGSAISLLQEVIREHPNGNAADASRKLIGEMNNAL